MNTANYISDLLWKDWWTFDKSLTFDLWWFGLCLTADKWNSPEAIVSAAASRIIASHDRFNVPTFPVQRSGLEFRGQAFATSNADKATVPESAFVSLTANPWESWCKVIPNLHFVTTRQLRSISAIYEVKWLIQSLIFDTKNDKKSFGIFSYYSITETRTRSVLSIDIR